MIMTALEMQKLRELRQKWSKSKVSNYFTLLSQRSWDRAEQDSGSSQRPIHEALKNILHMFLKALHSPATCGSWSCSLHCFCQLVLAKYTKECTVSGRHNYCNECVFHVDGEVKKHNDKILGLETPRGTKWKAKGIKKETVLCIFCDSSYRSLFLWPHCQWRGLHQ